MLVCGAFVNGPYALITTAVSADLGSHESLKGDLVGTTWGWEFDWTMRDGPQTLEQHKYMECRWVSLTFSSGGDTAGSRGGSSWAAPAFTLGAWKVHYPWVDTDSAFASSNATLDAVWHLARYTVHAASLDAWRRKFGDLAQRHASRASAKHVGQRAPSAFYGESMDAMASVAAAERA